MHIYARIPNNKSVYLSYAPFYRSFLLMSLKSCLLLLLLIGTSASMNAQRRLTFDANSRFDNLYFASNYLSVIRNKFFWSAGIEGGGYGLTDLYSPIAGKLTAPYRQANEVLVYDNKDYLLKSYISKVRGIGISGGIGRFFNFTDVHGLRLEASLRWICFEERFTGGYVNESVSKAIYQRNFFVESTFGLTLSVYHTIAVAERSTFYYGLKIPYFVPLAHSGYNPVNARDLMNAGGEIQLTAGISFMLPQKRQPKPEEE